MELEKRVLALEYEIKILKNEIQRTLLDVQEDILIHYYPSLETEEDASSQGIMPFLESTHDSPEMTSEPPETPTPIVIKPTTLEAIRSQAAATPFPKEREPPQRQTTDSPAAILELSSWVSASVEKMGAERTSRLVETCSARGLLDPDTKSLFLRLVSMSAREGSPETVAVNEVLGLVLKLSELLGSDTDIDKVLSLIEEAGLG